MRRSLVRVAGVFALVTVAGCQSGPTVVAGPPRLEPPPSTAVQLPGSESEFLETLMPMPAGDVRITYQVSGPAGMSGTLVATARAGGYRHESWAFDVPLPPVEGTEAGATSRIEGARVRTPDLMWTDAVEGAAVVRQSPLRAVARAYLDLEPGLRSLVAFRVGQWRAELQRGRAEHPGETSAVLGRDCLVTQVASHRVCVWEETGLPLSYEGDAFHVLAQQIEIGLQVDDALFDVPAGGQRAPDDVARVDPADAIVRLAAGDFAELSGLLQPDLRLSAPG